MGVDITGLGSAFDFGSKILDKLFPDKNEADKAKLALMQMNQAGEFKEMDNELAMLTSQASINTEEAKSSNLFVSGWRPFVGWVCASGLAYSVIGQPLLKTFGLNSPAIDTSVLFQILLGLLGIAGMRSFEKYKGVAK